MKENNDNVLSQSLSILVDDEQTNSEATVNAIISSPKLQQRWQSYHLIRDALLDELPERLSVDFSDRVMSALELEPVILAPRALKKSRPQMVKPLLGAAIAATVAAVTVISVQSFETKEYPQFTQASHYPMPPSPLSSPLVSPIRQASSPLAATGPGHFESSNKARWEGSQEDLQTMLNDYLMTHTENAQVGQIRGIVPYARLAGFHGKAQ